ncbi:hypothetical protein FNX48_027140, partial [Streptomyces sp. IF17]|nr:hypothetical protein [Streptomyces alkaliphilus]
RCPAANSPSTWRCTGRGRRPWRWCTPTRCTPPPSRRWWRRFPPYERLDPADLPAVDLRGRSVGGEPGRHGSAVPSSELPLHLAVYRARPEALAVVHTHAVHATAVSTLVEEVPA